MSAAVIQSQALALEDEALTPSQWAKLLGITPRAVRQAELPYKPAYVRGGIAKGICFADLPPAWRQKAEGIRVKHAASCYQSLLEIQAVETRWAPQREWLSYPESTRNRALQRKEIVTAYFRAIDADRSRTEATEIAARESARLLGKALCDRQIRRLVSEIEDRGGIDFAPLEAYCDGKSCPHIAARRQVKLQIPTELIAEFGALTTTTEHISGAYRKLEIDWLRGREVPGLGMRQGNEPFPYKLHQLRPFAASTPTRKLGSHGKARARRETLPSMRTSTAALRRAELLMLDDTRIDIVASDDLTGNPVELKSYWLLDVGPRRIEGFILRESGNIRANDVDTLLARTLRSVGIAAPNSGYRTTIKFERGTTACSPAREAFLAGSYPGQIDIDRTSMDGGKNHGADYQQSASGHWMGKGHIESFMRTVAYFLEHVPGQRGGTFRRQPAQLGLKGRNRETGLLEYDSGSRIDEAALLSYADNAMEWIETGAILPGGGRDRRLRITALWPVSWVMAALQEFVAYYNSRTDHRMEGFARIEGMDPETGKKVWRVESPNERAQALDRLCPTQRISAADACTLLTHTAKMVTVRAAGDKAGVVMDLEPWKNLRFWRHDSIACSQAAQLTTLERKFVACYDAEAIKLWTPQSASIPEVHLLSAEPGTSGSRYVETLPLMAYGDRTDADSMAEQAAKVRKVEQRHARELVRASGPIIARELARAEENVSKLQGVVTTLDEMRETAAPSQQMTQMRTAKTAQQEDERPTRRADLQDSASCDLARFQKEHQPEIEPVDAEIEPEIF